MREYRLNEFQGFDSLTLTEVPIPTPGPSQVLVKVHAVSLQQRDLIVAKGSYPKPLQPGIVPVSDMAGEIVAVGSSVTNFSVGDRVCANFAMPGFTFGDLGAEIDGVLTQFKVFDADPQRLVKFPDHLTYREASTLPCAALTAYAALYGPVPVKGGDVVLVQGTSGVSIFTLQFALGAGATVIITSSSDEKLDVAKKLGAQHVINYVSTPNWEDEVMRITDGKGADVVIDIGGASTLIQSVKACAFGGWVQLVGVIGHAKADLNALPLLAILKNACMRGVVMGGMERFTEMNQLIDSLKLRPYIDPREFTLDNAAEAFRYMDGRTHVGKVVIQVLEDEN
ncbi:NAD(P)-binding protein [Mycena maculata]|uniref:NAD(P)-binding protein n=1 Tax=Mycena maculata TaxID=230809 RepID=A0AAD7I4C2_9AGAR|nr:NAD(P)-binding protein [Mycena maculata]